MSIFLTLAFLFFVGSVFGWCLELVFRNVVHKSEKWINPGFCTGPYVPLYGFGLCLLFLLAQLEPLHLVKSSFWNKALVFLLMAVAMTVIEYIAGILCLKYFKVRLWDYSNMWGNLQGIICPLFSAIWAVMGAVYYFLIQPPILHMLGWLSRNLAFSFFIGLFFGVFLIDVAHSANLAVVMRRYAREHQLVLHYEEIKHDIRRRQFTARMRWQFFRPFHSDHALTEHLRELYETREERRRLHRPATKAIQRLRRRLEESDSKEDLS